MSDSMRIGVTRATGIAAANAVVMHLKRGIFISEYHEIDDYSLRFYKFAGSAAVTVAGRTNTGEWVHVCNTIVFKKDRNEGFPIEKVYASIHDYTPEHTAKEPVYFECRFEENGIRVTKLDRSPYEDPDRETDEDRRLALTT